MKLFYATLLLLVTVFSFLQNWLLVMLFFLLLFSFYFGAMVLIPVAILIDGYFGNYHAVPYLSLFSIAWFVVVEYLRPKLIDLTLPKEL